MSELSGHRFRVMGTDAHVVLHDGPIDALEQAERRARALERSWSRFLADSELSLLNRNAGSPMAVSPETALLLELAAAGWERTGGRFDPSVVPALVVSGYDRPFDQLAAETVVDGSPLAGRPTPGPAGMSVVRELGVAIVPPGVCIDPGGIGKGLAADLISAELVAVGAAGALVSIGGDLRVAGRPPDGGWTVEIDHDGERPLGTVRLAAGAVATSSILRRRWRTRDGETHHVIDPRTGRATTGAAVACTVVAGEAWWAETLSTALLVTWEGPAREVVAADLLGDAAAVLTTRDGDVIRVGSDRVHLEGVGVP